LVLALSIRCAGSASVPTANCPSARLFQPVISAGCGFYLLLIALFDLTALTTSVS